MNLNPERYDFKTADFDELVGSLRKLFSERGDEYNKLSVVHDYFPFGVVSYKQMLWIKALREMNNLYPLENVLKWKTDSIEDLIVYSLFYWDYLRKIKEKLLKDEINTKNKLELVEEDYDDIE